MSYRYTFSKPLRPCQRLVDRTLYLVSIGIHKVLLVRLSQRRSMIIIFDNNDFVSVLMVVTLYVRVSHLRLGETKSTAEPPPAESASTFTELSTIFNSSSQNCNDLF